MVILPSKTTTSPQQVHEGHTDEAIHIQDQVGFLKVQKQKTQYNWKRIWFKNACFTDWLDIDLGCGDLLNI